MGKTLYIEQLTGGFILTVQQTEGVGLIDQKREVIVTENKLIKAIKSELATSSEQDPQKETE